MSTFAELRQVAQDVAARFPPSPKHPLSLIHAAKAGGYVGPPQLLDGGSPEEIQRQVENLCHGVGAVGSSFTAFQDWVLQEKEPCALRISSPPVLNSAVWCSPFHNIAQYWT